MVWKGSPGYARSPQTACRRCKPPGLARQDAASVEIADRPVKLAQHLAGKL
jgi:hypothetical protein